MPNSKDNGWRPDEPYKGVYVEPHAQRRMRERFPTTRHEDGDKIIRLIQAMVHGGFWHEPNLDASASWLVEDTHRFTRETVYLRCCWDPDGKVRVKTVMNKNQCQVFPEGSK